MTPHINAKVDDIAKLVIMPGDPLRAKFIAEKYLKDAKLVSDTRLILAYTGFFNDKEVTVMASGMGMPSMAIYAYELFNVYNVEKIIRVGSCGALLPDIKLKEVILAEKAYTSSNFAYQYSGTYLDIINSSDSLNQDILLSAKELGIDIKKGIVNTSDLFYHDYYDKELEKVNPLAVEMECFGLFYVAKKSLKEASAILTVSDNIVTKEEMSSLDREKTFTEAIKLALNAITR